MRTKYMVLTDVKSKFTNDEQIHTNKERKPDPGSFPYIQKWQTDPEQVLEHRTIYQFHLE